MVKRYGPVTAVDGLTLTAGAGQVTAVLGPNGAGKTTTIEVCEGYRRIDSGTVRILGLDPIATPPRCGRGSASCSSRAASRPPSRPWST